MYSTILQCNEHVTEKMKLLLYIFAGPKYTVYLFYFV